MENKTKNVKSVLKAVFDKLKGLNQQQKMVLGGLLLIFLLSLYMNAHYKPNMVRMKAAQRNIVVYQNKINMLKVQIPETELEKENLSVLEKNVKDIEGRIKTIEAKLPPQNKLPQILGEVINRGSKYDIDFISIVPKFLKKEKDIYSSLEIELEFETTYKDAISYLETLQKEPSFLFVEEVNMEEQKDSRERLIANVKLSSLVIDTPKAVGAIDRENEKYDNLTVERDPFTSDSEPASDSKKEDKEKMILQGIVYNGDNSVAVIDDEIYRLGEAVDDKIIKVIDRNRVILEDKDKEVILTLEEMPIQGEEK